MGLFISVEGGEGAGKSTQLSLLAEWLQQQGYSVIRTREPGGTAEAELLRQLLVRDAGHHWLPMTELLLMNAARYQHVVELIKPALGAGKIVLCDRFVHSSIAYQGYGHGLGEELVRKQHQLLFGDFYPDVTFIFTLPSQDGLNRASQRQDNEQRFENFGTAFHERVAAGFAQLAAQDKGCVAINAAQTPDKIFAELQHFLIPYLEKLA